MSIITNRYDGLLVSEAINSNPNGDKSRDNEPCCDSETGLGLIKPECIKRKIRDAVAFNEAGKQGYEIYVRRKTTYSGKQAETKCASPKMQEYEQLINGTFAGTAEACDLPALNMALRDAMCKRFFDVRTMGTTFFSTYTEDGLNGGIVGPLQVEMTESVDPVYIKRMSITRVVRAKEKDDKTNTEKKGVHIAKASVVAYGLYVTRFHITPSYAKDTKFSEDDLRVLMNALVHLYDDDCSAWRSGMYVRKLVLFKHESSYGSMPLEELYNTVHLNRKEGVITPRSINDYEFSIDESLLPKSIQIMQYV